MLDKIVVELCVDGFFIIGDLGKMDEDGYVYIVGCNKDLIIFGGYNIYFKEIELVLDDQLYVLESVVIGVLYVDFGEMVVGLIVVWFGEMLDLDVIGVFVVGVFVWFKYLCKLIVIDVLFCNMMGKV